MTEQMPGWAAVALVVVLAGWTLVMSMRTEARVHFLPTWPRWWP